MKGRRGSTGEIGAKPRKEHFPILIPRRSPRPGRTVREIIRARVYQGVHDYNQQQPETFRGLVEPSEAEKALNGFKLKTPRKIDWEKQFEKAVEGFQGVNAR